MMPHLAETCWEALGRKTLLVDTPWPSFDESLTKVDVVTYAIQVNGKLRATRQVHQGAEQADVERFALEIPEVARALEGRPPKKTIFVRNRIVNIVV